MKKHYFILTAFLLFHVLCTSMSQALTLEEGSDAPTRTIEDYIKDYVDIPKGGTDWKIFGKTQELNIEEKDSEGMDIQFYKPVFSQELQNFNGKEIVLKGFMFPLENNDEQSVFLFGPFPMNCPFQYHVGPSLVIGVHTKDNTTIPFSYEPIVLKGTLQLIPEDKNFGLFYKLNNTVLVQ